MVLDPWINWLALLKKLDPLRGRRERQREQRQLLQPLLQLPPLAQIVVALSTASVLVSPTHFFVSE